MKFSLGKISAYRLLQTKVIFNRFEIGSLSFFSIDKIIVSLKLYYYLLALLSLLCFALSAIYWLWPAPQTHSYQDVPAIYNYQTSAEKRQKIWASLAPGNLLSHNPLWLKLSSELDYVGLNARPDNPQGSQAIFQWVKLKQPLYINLLQPLYFSWKNSSSAFQANPEQSELGIKILEIKAVDHQTALHIELSKPDEQGHWQSFESFWLQNAAVKNTTQNQALMSLQKMNSKWWGPDLFLIHHSDPRAQEPIQMQRLEFMVQGKKQIFYLGSGQGLIYKNKEWIPCPLGPLTQEHPLFVVEGFDEDKLLMVAWNVAGDSCYHFSIQKQQESWNPKELQAQIRLISTRGKNQILMQIGQQRWGLKVLDWMIHTAQGWQKITSSDLVDHYVSGQLEAELLIFKELQTNSSGTALAKFRLYSKARSQMIDFEVGSTPLQIRPSVSEPAYDEPKDRESYFIPLPKSDHEQTQWPFDQDRAWQPPQEISPQKMLEILKAIHEEGEEAELDANR